MFLRWKSEGMPRNGPIYNDHMKAKLKCKNAIRFIKRYENDLRRQSLATKLAEMETKDFWKEIRNVRNGVIPRPLTVDGITGEENIASAWETKFEELLNSVPTDIADEDSDEDSEYDMHECDTPDIAITVDDIKSAVISFKKGKASGPDKLSVEHIIHASYRLITLLCLCLNAFLTHGTLPCSLMMVTIVPIIKNKAAPISAMSNYRPVATPSVISKIFESVLLKKLSPWLYTEDNQFGFKKNLGTDQCIYGLKEVVELYKSMKGLVHLCFLDASKAFDRVNHHILFQRLAQRGVPKCFIRMLAFWYRNQKMAVRWGAACSESFTVTNGVRQGGILSPFLFNVFMDALSVELNQKSIGCIVGGKVVNHLMYADDLVLIAPSSGGLQRLLDICYEFGLSNDVMYNGQKSVTMCCKSKSMSDVKAPTFMLGSTPIDKVESVKYLGHILTSDMSDDFDISRQNKSLYARGNMLIRKFHMCTIDVKLKLFETHCSSMYSAQLWSKFRKDTMKRFVVSYHNILKRFIGLSKYESTSATCTYFRVFSCESVMRNLMYKFIARVEASENVIMRAILESDLYFCSVIRRSWLRRLYTNGTFQSGVT